MPNKTHFLVFQIIPWRHWTPRTSNSITSFHRLKTNKVGRQREEVSSRSPWTCHFLKVSLLCSPVHPFTCAVPGPWSPSPHKLLFTFYIPDQAWAPVTPLWLPSAWVYTRLDPLSCFSCTNYLQAANPHLIGWYGSVSSSEQIRKLRLGTGQGLVPEHIFGEKQTQCPKASASRQCTGLLRIFADFHSSCWKSLM